MWVSAAFLLVLAVNAHREESFGRPASQRCRAGWQEFDTQCYKFFSDLKTWAEAEKQCVDLGGNLASVRNRGTQKFLKTFVTKRATGIPHTWIGAHDATQNGIWFWSDGSQFEYTYWHTGEPNNSGGIEHCVEMGDGAEQRWKDVSCSNQLNFVCKK